VVGTTTDSSELGRGSDQPGARDEDRASAGETARTEPAATFATQRAASLRAMFPNAARPPGSLTSADPSGPAALSGTPAVSGGVDAPAVRRRRFRLWPVILGLFALGALAGVAVFHVRGDKPAGAAEAQSPKAAPTWSASDDGPRASSSAAASVVPDGPTLSPTRTPEAAASAVASSSARAASARPASGRANPSAVNLALHRPATASNSEGSAWRPANAFDGQPSTRWSSGFSDPQWIAVDLGESWAVTRIRLLWELAYATKYRVDVSLDGTNWSTVYATSSGRGGTVDIDAGPVAARYVRMYGTRRSGGYGYSLFEFEVR
jgi:hypothetical protein